MTKHLELEFLEKREKIQKYFWDIVGAEEHISLPKLRYAIIKEFKNDNDRFIQLQIRLMQTEARVNIQSRVKVWIKKPSINLL